MNDEILNELENERQKVLGFYLKLLMGTIGLGFITALLTDAIAGTIVGSLAFCVGLLFTGRRKFVNHFKSKVLTSIFNQTFGKCEFHFNDGFSKDDVFATELTNYGNTYHSDDLIKGEYRGIPFERADVAIRQVQSTGKSVMVIPIFVGQWMIFSLPYKKFDSTTKVVENEFFKASNPTGNFFNKIKVEKMETESIPFNDKFSIFTNNEQDAFYLLTPVMMEKLLELEKKYDKVRIGFINGQVHVLLATNKNQFEPSVSSKIDDEYINELQSQANIIKDIADILQIEGKDSEDEYSHISEYDPSWASEETEGSMTMNQTK